MNNGHPIITIAHLEPYGSGELISKPELRCLILVNICKEFYEDILNDF